MEIFQYGDKTEKHIYSRPVVSYINENLPIKQALMQRYFEDSFFTGRMLVGNASTFFDLDESNNVIDWNINSYLLLYRKKNLNKIRILDEDIIEKIKRKTTLLTFYGLYYLKFEINEKLDYDSEDENLNYKRKIDCNFFKSFDDKLLNFQFINNTFEEISRTLYMDYSFLNIKVNKFGLYNDTLNEKFKFFHKFLLKNITSIEKTNFMENSSEGIFFDSPIIIQNY